MAYQDREIEDFFCMSLIQMRKRLTMARGKRGGERKISDKPSSGGKVSSLRALKNRGGEGRTHVLFLNMR